jgi:hypothetical protein
MSLEKKEVPNSNTTGKDGLVYNDYQMFYIYSSNLSGFFFQRIKKSIIGYISLYVLEKQNIK